MGRCRDLRIASAVYRWSFLEVAGLNSKHENACRPKQGPAADEQISQGTQPPSRDVLEPAPGEGLRAGSHPEHRTLDGFRVFAFLRTCGKATCAVVHASADFAKTGEPGGLGGRGRPAQPRAQA
jgi:hypothetical protein